MLRLGCRPFYFGAALELDHDHDPAPALLRYQFEDRLPGCFYWSYLPAGPDLWRVRIGKLDATDAPADSDCCCSGGACGG